MNMVPDSAVFIEIGGDDKILSNGHPASQWRTELRHIPNLRNAISIASIYVQTVGIIWTALALRNPITYVIAFLLMGRAHAQLLALMHESVHRLLFRKRKLNDFAGRWLLGYMSFVNTDGYRYVHMAHHREEFGPNEPDIPLYANYPITRASFWRKMRRDGLGSTGFRMLRGQFVSVFNKKSPDQNVQRNTQRKIFALHTVLLILSVIFVNPWVYAMLWLLPYITVWRVMNRLRSIAEHGGLRADSDRRVTTHSVKQHLFSSFYFVPFNLGWHIAHHTDSGIPFRSLPKYHRQLRASGFVTDAYEYSSYLAIWRALRSRPESITSAK
ncbi:MAG: fatty acid desaturase [Ilumatobacteraceae bacterium]